MAIPQLKKVKKECLCPSCAGLCCRYVALPIETPEDREDYDDIRWYLAHEGFSIFVDEGEWYVNIASKCKYLNNDNMCNIYLTRPKICREYKDNNCDYHGGDYGYDQYYASTEALDEFIAEKFSKE